MFVPTQPHGVKSLELYAVSAAPARKAAFPLSYFFTLFSLAFPSALAAPSAVASRQSPPPSPPVKPHKTLSSSSLLSTPPLVSVHVIVFNNPNLITF